MTPEKVRGLLAAATPGPWERNKYYKMNVVAPTGSIICRVDGSLTMGRIREIAATPWPDDMRVGSATLLNGIAESGNAANSDLVVAAPEIAQAYLDVCAERDALANENESVHELCDRIDRLIAERDELADRIERASRARSRLFAHGLASEDAYNAYISGAALSALREALGKP